MLARFAYRDALGAFIEARRLADGLGDRETSGVVGLNITSLYLQMGDLGAAGVEARRAAEALESVPGSAYRGEALAGMARLKAREEGLATAVPVFLEAIDVADRQGDIALKARVVNQLGMEYLNGTQLREADQALTEAFRLRVMNHNRDLSQSYRPLGLLRLAEGDRESAEVLLNRAISVAEDRPGLVPRWMEYHARGQLRMAQGRLGEAVRDFRRALVLARQWRLEVLPTDSVRTSTATGLAEIDSSFVRAACQLYARTQQRSLAREAFEAAEDLRAAALRVSGGEVEGWRSRLPADYGQTLEQLRLARVRVEREGNRAAREEARSLRLRLEEMEVRAGAPGSPDSVTDLAEQVSRVLTPSEALVSLHLDEPHSYAWVVTHRRFTFRSLPPGGELRKLMGEFSDAVRNGKPETVAIGERLYRLLFSPDLPDAEGKQDWLLSASGSVLDVPFSSLVVGRVQGRPEYLIERHSVTLLPAAQLLVSRRTPGNSADTAAGPFLGVADPIYNDADPRRQEGGHETRLQLPRLSASDAEVRACARAWRADSAPVLLEGVAATRQDLEGALDRGPSVIHLAAHVVRSSDEPPRQMIQLSLLPGGDPDYLGADDVACWRLPKPAVVVLSGCASGRTEKQAPVFNNFSVPSAARDVRDSGLIGMARAWLAAGARAVVASHWRTPDDTGELFRSFYEHLRESGGFSVSAALAHAQRDMLESHTWRSQPKYWAAYFAIGRN